jgi:flagellar basal-body rod protein FlgB
MVCQQQTRHQSCSDSSVLPCKGRAAVRSAFFPEEILAAPLSFFPVGRIIFLCSRPARSPLEPRETLITTMARRLIKLDPAKNPSEKDQTKTTMQTDKIQLLSNAMQTYQWRMQALTSNIANLDTPGYQRIAVTFEDALQEVRRSIPGLRNESEVTARVKVDDRPPMLEDELMELADTQMRNQLATRAIRGHFALISSGITGRPL